MSVVGIIRMLQASNIKSPQGRDKWNKRAIEKMLVNTKYYGDVVLPRSAHNDGSKYGMDFDVYQFGKEGLPENVADLALKEAKSYDTTEISPALDINGINVACCRAFDSFEGKTYDTLTYYLDDGDTYLEIVFWLDGDNAEELSDMIISSLSSTKN